MFGKCWRETAKRITRSVLCGFLVLALVSCSQPQGTSPSAKVAPSATGDRAINIEEVSPPDVLQMLRRKMDRYEPQVKIVGPKPDSTIEETDVTVRFEVEDFPMFKDPELALGPHLHVFLDDQPYQAIYDAKQSLTFKDLSPGTHTIRAFASRPWHESVKTPGAFAALTFHVFAPTQSNQPDPTQPLLTYSRPQGEYGAEPIMLDYYLTVPGDPQNAGRKVASDSRWKVRVSLDGKSFTTSEMPPLYLKGFQPGANWVKLELLNSAGKLVPNAFSESVRLVTLKPNGQDSLSKLVRGELSAQAAEQIVDKELSQQKAVQRREALSKRQVLEDQPVVPIKPTPPSPAGSLPLEKVPAPPVSRPSPAVIAKPTITVPPTVQPLPKALSTPSPSPTITPAIKPRAEGRPEPKAAEPKTKVMENPSKDTPFWAKFRPNEFLGGKGTEAPAKAPIPKVGDDRVAPKILPSPSAIASPSPTAIPSAKAVMAKPEEPAKVDAVKPPAADWRKFLQFRQESPDKLPIARPTEPPGLPDRYLKAVQQTEAPEAPEAVPAPTGATKP